MAHPAHMRRVLIVEDDDLLGRILRLTLARRGYTVADAYSVANARESLEVAAMVGRPFDLLLLDINLPDQTGWDLLRYLRNGGHSASPDSLGPQAPAGMHEESTGLPQVIVMTAVRPPECRLREFRPAGVLVKPFPINALLQLIQRVLHISGDFEPAAEAYGELDDTDMRDAAITSANGLQAHNALDAQDADGT